MKKKVLKVQIGESWDKETKKKLPIYNTYWEQKDGSYSRTEKVWVSEVEVPDDKINVDKITA